MNSSRLKHTTSIYRNQIYFYTYNEHSASDIEKIPFTVTSKNKIVKNNLTKKSRSCTLKTAVLKEVKEDLSKWKDILSSWIGRLQIVKIAIKTPNWLHCRNDKLVLKFIWKCKGLKIARRTKLKTHMFWFEKLNYEAVVIQII